MKSYTIATKRVPAVWLQETEKGIIYHNDNTWPDLRYTSWQGAIQKVIDDCGVLGDLEWAIRGLGPWEVEVGTGSGFWYIKNGERRVKIGSAGSERVNYYDRAMKECVRRNAKVHGIKLPERY